ncbi:MAG: hemerythrin domain-containing protein [Chitinophagaceae bacterium]
MEDKPIKRDPNIVLLSREHHFGLLFGWKLRQGLKFGIEPERMKGYIMYFWGDNLREHFATEERLLFQDKSDDMVAEGLKQHKGIQYLVEEIKQSEQPTVAQMNELADLVSDHIRFEERELFPHLEEKFSDVELINIGRILEELHRTPLKDDYPDEFWLKKS